MKHTPPPQHQVQAPAPLFRQQALAHQARSLQGEVVLALPMRMRVLIVLAALIVTGALIFAATASYSRIETVSGWVVPEGGLIRITARQGGVLERLDVAEGDEVAAGQSLAELRLSQDLDGGDAGTAIADYLGIELSASRAQAEAERERLEAQQRNLRLQRAAMQREMDAGNGRIDAITQRLNLMRANSDRMKEISSRGFGSNKQIEESEVNVLLAEQELVDARTAMMTMARQIGDIDAQLQALPFSISAAEAQARASQAALERQGTELAVMNTYHATASVAGRVVAVPVSVGQTLDAQTAIAVITPAGSQLQAELMVPSRSAGFIQAGQEVRLMYQAFPYQKFGTARGVIASVSRTVLAPADVTIPGLQITEPVFRVKVTLDRDVMTAYGQDMPIQPGMLLSAGIVQDRRSLIEWLLDPIYAVGRL
ncbi:Colicin V secretion protein CvaA [Paracoccus haematequi]|uniref:Colicin V secretion protein CvaA n=1 Tax=Paracoccus haematequi TaxID=2491866 RepID=A0A447IQ38_9RHOB|nr:HlyD family efflux transporter periplasmic adaptor subunit [Paracoccus haematequi]VDS09594.1 Colicin V secretion protein CvaA [Paracoccus haematequi]